MARTSWIRWMLRKDLPQIVEIERQCFDLAWTMDDFLNCMNQRNHISMVVEQDDKIVGFMVYALFKDRIDLISIAVLPEYRKLGYGTALMVKLAKKVTGHNREKMTVSVRESNLYAQLFFRKCDFLAVGVTPRYYEDTGEDAYNMEWLAPPDPERVPHAVNNRIAQYEES